MTKDLSWLRTLPGRPLIVAEFKLLSPYGWVNPLPMADAFDRCYEVADIVSIHTDQLWGGSWEHLRIWTNEIHARGAKRVLAKGFHPTIKHVERALQFADYCLTVGWCPGGELRERCWQEVETRDQLINSFAPWVVLNSRDPRTGQRRVGRDIAAERVLSSVDRIGRKVCQASNIRSAADVVEGADAILIGEGLYT